MPKIFISYRREDSKHAVGRLFAALRRHVRDPKRDLFIDIDNIPKGVDFVTHLDGQVAKTDILLAVIGPRWLEALDPATNQRRLDNPSDFVRVEVAAALKRGIPVVPVVLDDTQIPSLSDLPDDLKPLARRNGERLRHESFDADVARLIAGLPKSPDAPEKKRGGAAVLALVSILVLAGLGAAAWYYNPLNWKDLVGLQTAALTTPAQAASGASKPSAASTTTAQAQLDNASTAVPGLSPSSAAPPPKAPAAPTSARETATAPQPPSAGSAPAAPGVAVKPSQAAEKAPDANRPAQKPAPTNTAVANTPGAVTNTQAPAKSTASPPVAAALTKTEPASAAPTANKPAQGAPAPAGAAADNVASSAVADAAAPIRKPGDIIRDKLEDGSEGPEMVVLPLQSFRMGATDAVGETDEHPQHPVKFASAFAMGKYEVTVGEYNACVAAGSCSSSESATYGARLPAFKVSYDDALAYAKWLSEQTKQIYRLPSEAEWEFAAWARSPNPVYPWGTNPDAGCNQANGAPIITNNGTEQLCDNAKGYWVVDGAGHKPNDFGLYDTLGNVQEWVKDCYAPYPSPAAESDGKAVEDCYNPNNHVVRGGGWNSARKDLRVRNRSWLASATKAYDVGFRVLRELEK